MDAMTMPTLHVNGRCTGLRVRRATGFWSHAAGLWAGPNDGRPLALELRPCAAVHTLAMRRPIDVVFVDADGMVLHAVPRLAPWRVALLPRAAATWELPSGACAALSVHHGSRLQGAVPVVAPLPATRTAARGDR
jgi:uncharacterized protein